MYGWWISKLLLKSGKTVILPAERTFHGEFRLPYCLRTSSGKLLQETWRKHAHRIHGTGIFTYISLIFMVNVGIWWDSLSAPPCLSAHFLMNKSGHGDTGAVSVQHFSDISPIAKWPNAQGNTSKSCKLWRFLLTKVKLWRPAGHDTLSRLWSKFWPKVKPWRPTGHITLSRLWLKFRPKVKLWRPAGHITSSRLWLKLRPNVKLWRPAGHVTLSRFWLNRPPKVKPWRTLKACWPYHIVQVLIEQASKSQTLKACWPCQVVQAPIEMCS